MDHGGTEVFAYADDVVIIGRALPSTKVAFLKLDKGACKVGLRVIKEDQDPSFMEEEAGACQQHNVFGNYRFGAVTCFQYLGSSVNEDRDEMEKIRRKTGTRNRAYFPPDKILSNRQIGHAGKF